MWIVCPSWVNLSLKEDELCNKSAVNDPAKYVMAINSKRKGNAFERKVATIFSKRFTHIGDRTSSFRRNADSGSYFGGKNRERLASHDVSLATFGDIITPTAFRYTLEAKHYKDAPSFNQIVNQSCCQLDAWIEQAEADAISAGKPPIIVAKWNNVPEVGLVSISETDGTPREITSPVSYRGYHIVPLDDLLALPDWWWFRD